jgi:signal transduction histidine kinase
LIAVISVADLGGRFDTVENIGLLPVFLLSYRLGASARAWSGIVCLIPLVAALQIGSGFNPLLEMITVGPWAVGQMVRSRARLRDDLAVRGAELEREQARFAAQAVRYDRARIARELHDIVAHCLSVIVVQANAAGRQVSGEPAMAAIAFDDIAELCRQAQTEIERLASLWDRPDANRLNGIGDLIAHARAAGTVVEYRVVGADAGLSPGSATAAYRVVQEALTNALRHAPGTRVTVVVSCLDGAVDVEVANEAGTRSDAVVSRGGGNGLVGMRERIAARGGTLDAGCTTDGGWRVTAHMPAGSRQVTAAI